MAMGAGADRQGRHRARDGGPPGPCHLTPQRGCILATAVAALHAPIGPAWPQAPALRGHEFHYSTITDQPDAPLAPSPMPWAPRWRKPASRRGLCHGHLLPPDRTRAHDRRLRLLRLLRPRRPRAADAQGRGPPAARRCGALDDLSSGPILAHARPGADLVGVGKRAGRASPKQDHVSRLLVDYALTGAAHRAPQVRRRRHLRPARGRDDRPHRSRHPVGDRARRHLRQRRRRSGRHPADPPPDGPAHAVPDRRRHGGHPAPGPDLGRAGRPRRHDGRLHGPPHLARRLPPA
jgi:hypothetical protein